LKKLNALFFTVHVPRDGNGSGRARIVPTRYPTRKKKSYPLPAPLPVGYPA